MLKNVSWGMYLEFLVIALVIYYCYIGIKYFKDDIKSIINGKLKIIRQSKQTSTGTQMDDPSFEELKAVSEDLRTAVFERVGKYLSKQELLEQLQERLSLYEGLYKPAYRHALNNSIILNAKEICGVVFSEDELNSAWDTMLR